MLKSKTENSGLLNGLVTKRQVAAVAVFVLLGLCLVISPTQAPVVLFKASLVTFFVVLAYFVDRSLSPQVDLEDLVESVKNGDKAEREAAVKLAQAVLLRRAIVTLAVVIGGCLGL